MTLEEWAIKYDILSHVKAELDKRILSADTQLLINFMAQFYSEQGEYLPSPCLVWTGYIDQNGYGICGNLYTDRHVHRQSFYYENGYLPDIKEGLLIRHLCHNRACGNPQHLVSGSYQDNMNDMITAGRRAVKRGEDCSHAILTQEQASHIKWLTENCVMNRVDIADKFKISRYIVDQIALGYNWVHVEAVKPDWYVPLVRRA